MTLYATQYNIDMPQWGKQDINHYVKTFSNTDPLLLDDDVNAFLLSLIPPPDFTPTIISITFSIAGTGMLNAYSCQIHYVLVG